MKRRTFLFLSALGLLHDNLKAAAKWQRQNQGSTTASRSDLRLWYRQPASEWNEALPIGNGRLAAMVFGGVESERLQLNEEPSGLVRNATATPEAFRTSGGGAANGTLRSKSQKRVTEINV